MKNTETQRQNASEHAQQENRKSLRRELRKARNSLSPEQQQVAAKQLVQVVLASNVLQESQSCAVYLSNDGELDTTHLINHCWQHNIQVSLPVLHPFTAGNLLFLDYRADSSMCINKYGISEPICETPNVVPLSDIDLLFVPLVGFDENGNRLGMGGGYYDRTLKSVHCSGHSKIIGLAHDCQQVEKLPVQSWDVPLNAIITPTRTINCL